MARRCSWLMNRDSKFLIKRCVLFFVCSCLKMFKKTFETFKNWEMHRKTLDVCFSYKKLEALRVLSLCFLPQGNTWLELSSGNLL